MTSKNYELLARRCSFHSGPFEEVNNRRSRLPVRRCRTGGSELKPRVMIVRFAFKRGASCPEPAFGLSASRRERPRDPAWLAALFGTGQNLFGLTSSPRAIVARVRPRVPRHSWARVADLNRAYRRCVVPVYRLLSIESPPRPARATLSATQR